MGPLDAFIVYKFIRLLTTAWDETDAFKLGVIDATGKPMKKVNDLTDEQEKSYTLFHRVVFNLKRLIEKLPGGKSKIATYAAALYLLREQMGDEEGVIVLERSFMSYLKDHNAVDESYLTEQHLPEEMLPQGHYKLLNNILDIKGESVHKDTVLVAKTSLKAVARVLGVDVFELQVANTGKKVIVSHEDIREV